jgi:hypothetical protein
MRLAHSCDRLIDKSSLVNDWKVEILGCVWHIQVHKISRSQGPDELLINWSRAMPIDKPCECAKPLLKTSLIDKPVT